jgi:hypothetical protein
MHLAVSDSQARTRCGFLFTTAGVFPAGFLKGFASRCFDSI